MTTTELIKQRSDELLADGGFFSISEIDVNGKRVKQFDNANNDLVELLQNGRIHGKKLCMVYEEERWSYDDFYSKADAINAILQMKIGLKPGDRVAIAMRNYPEWGAVFFGAIFSGAVVVPLNSWGKKDELMFGIKDSGCRVLICDQQRFELISDQANNLDIDIFVTRSATANFLVGNVYSLESQLSAEAKNIAPLAKVSADDDAMMLYTSGSTGTPKGVPLTHRAACQAMMNYFYGGALTAALDGTRGADTGASEPDQMANLLCVPLFHGTGLFAGLLVAIALGVKTVIMHKWDPVIALKLIEKEKITQTNAVPALIQSLLSCDEIDHYNTSSLKRIGTGGSASPTTLPKLIREKLNNPVCGTGWGMTETCVLGVSMGGSAYDLKPNAAGIKSPIIDLRVTDQQGTVLPNGSRGEIECRGVTVFNGYWGNDEATQNSFNGEWLQTGDVGYLDDDEFLFITGRSKDLVIRGGENIFPGEIEDAAYAMDGVMEVAVYGVPDDILGEELSMEVFLNNTSTAEEKDIRNLLSKKLAGFKVPRHIKICSEPLPKNVANKIDKLAMRKAWKIS